VKSVGAQGAGVDGGNLALLRFSTFKAIRDRAPAMTVVALLADPPRPGHVLPELVDADVCSAEEAADLYGAMVQDAAVAVARSGGDLLVNYPPPVDFEGAASDAADESAAGGEADESGGDATTDESWRGASVDDPVDPEAELRELLVDVLARVEEIDDVASDVRFEVQVGSTETARIGNAVTHLLEAEDVASAAVLRPTAPLLDRTVIDGTAMKLRRDEVVVGPAPGGRVYYAGFTEPIDFADALAGPAVETLAGRGADAGLGVAFEAMQPLLETPDDLRTTLPLLRARQRANQPVPAATAAVLDRVDLVPFDG